MGLASELLSENRWHSQYWPEIYFCPGCLDYNMEQPTHKTSYYSPNRLTPFTRHLFINKIQYQRHTDPHLPHTYTLTHTDRLSVSLPSR